MNDAIFSLSLSFKQKPFVFRCFSGDSIAFSPSTWWWSKAIEQMCFRIEMRIQNHASKTKSYTICSADFDVWYVFLHVLNKHFSRFRLVRTKAQIHYYFKTQSNVRTLFNGVFFHLVSLPLFYLFCVLYHEIKLNWWFNKWKELIPIQIESD